MSGRIEKRFEALQRAQRKALIPFVTAGDPDPGFVVELMHSLVEGGADLLELGVPFSDPMADGPVIQASSERAIRKGVSLEHVLGWVQRFREQDEDTPVILMGYMNPFERFGVEALATEAARAGVDGFLTVDCPPEELGTFGSALKRADLANIRLVAPTTPEQRVARVTQGARGFIYYVSFKGTTGAGHLDAGSVDAPLARLRRHTDLPIAVGFGISDAASARAVSRQADGVVIGSALVDRLAQSASSEDALNAARSFLREIRVALDASA
ncbi:MAG: tryptophan synthase subunit alpha [Xanthomonadales bacterium]|nr:tryptophan synthase subunit alpha [Xanthomonadales bacterium]